MTRSAAGQAGGYFFILLLCGRGLGFAMAGMPGGLSDVKKTGENSVQLEELGRFAVSEHNSKQNGNLEFVKVVDAKQQVVAGIMYYLTIEVVSGGQRGQWMAKVWSKPWQQHRSLEEFKFIGSKVTAADIGVLTTEPSHLNVVAVDDPSVTEAADYAVKAIQRRSNSLFPYELQEIVSAHAERGDGALFKVVMKLRRGTKEETCNAEVHCSGEGQWMLKKFDME